MKTFCKKAVFVLLLLCLAFMPLATLGTVQLESSSYSSSESTNSSKSNTFTASAQTPKIYLEAEKTDKNGVAQIGESRYKVGFYIKATSPVSNVKVSWRTRDMTAIASQGDYNAKDTTYTLNGTSSDLLYVVVYKKGVATKVDIKIPRNSTGITLPADDAITRNFFIEITGLNCDENVATIDKTRKQLIATSGSEYTFSVAKIYDETNPNTYMSYFSSYEWPNRFSGHPWWKYYVPKEKKARTAIYIDKSPNIQDGHKYYSDAAYPSMGIFNEFISRGYADLYATIWADTYEDKAIGNSDNIRVSIVYADNHEYICQYDIEYGGWSSEHTYDMLQMQTSSRYTTNPGKVILGDNITRHYYDGRYYYYYREEYWEVKDPNRRIQVEFWDYEDYEGRYFYDVNVKTIIADTKAPEVLDYYLQKQTIKNGESLGLSVRFSEPVQIINNNKLPYISAIINNKAIYSANFEYVSGSGTDTLYFEWKPFDKSIDITSFTINEFHNTSSISDYSLSMNKVQNPQIFESDDTDSFKGDSSKFTYYDPENATLTNEKFLKHNILPEQRVEKVISYRLDLRAPDVRADLKGETSEGAKRYAEIPIIIENLGEDGKLYYSWEPSLIEPEVYRNEITNLSDVYTIRTTGMNGKYYLYIKAVSAYGKVQKLNVGQFLFDDSPPDIDLTIAGDMASRIFNLKVTDGAETTDWTAGVKQVVLTIASDPEGKNIVKQYTYNGNAEKSFSKSQTVKAEELGLGENEYKDFYVYVTAEDDIGNSSKTGITKYKFDRRTFIDATFESAIYNGKNNVLEPSNTDFKIIDFSNVKSDENLNLTFTTSDTTGGTIDWIVKNEKGKTFTFGGAKGKTTQQISVSGDIAPGYYTISFTLSEAGTVKYSQEMVFYFTRGMQDEGLKYYTKINKGTLLSNNVFQLNDDLPYYYMDKDGNIQNVRYSNSSKPATFSSRYEAIKYIKYMEYQDLYPIKINATQADLLNGKSSPNFLKASGETMVAQENQVWIRYKTASFDKDPTTSQWAYYYYDGNNLTIQQNLLSINLLASIDTISERLAKNYGKNVVLAGEGNLNRFNEPYLEQSQIHYDYESVSVTKCGMAFDTAIYYDGDVKIYNSTVTESGKTYSVASNLPLEAGDYNRLFFKSKDNTNYTEVDFSKYNNLSQIITASGIYEMIELDTNGARKYSIYIDRDAPTLIGYMQNAEGKIVEKEFNKSSQGITYTTKSFVFGQFSEIEKDEFAYVAVWKYLTNKTGELLNIYLRSELETNSYALGNGDYHVEVYDRSGNGYSFVIRVSTQSLVCDTVEKENEYVTVSCNREENEIQVYEIYLNGELITSKYTQRLKLEESGFYTVRIIDIYNNKYEKEFNFERAYPTISWQYYDAELGDYVNYNYGVSKKMQITKVDDVNFKIITSALLRFKYDGEYTYQFIGDVDKDEVGISHIVRINKLQNFTLKISYTKYNEPPITYTCEVDDTAPNISVRNDLEKFALNEIQYFEEQLESGNVGDKLKYNTISYSRKNVVSSYLTSGDTVQSRILKLAFSDNYGISLVRVYLDDALIIEKTEDFSNIILSRYGKYKIEAYDSFENKSEFTFTNSIQDNLRYYVDGIEENSDESTLQYFSDESTFTKVQYASKNIELLLKNNSTLKLKITSSGAVDSSYGLSGESIYSALEITDGKIYFLTYSIHEDSKGDRYIATEHSTAIFDIAQADKVVNEWYLIINQAQGGKNIYAKYDSQNNISIKIENDSSPTCTVEGRVEFSNVEPFYFRVELSKEKADVVIKNASGENITTNQDEDTIKINEAFYIDQTSLSDKVVSIKVYYSEVDSFGSPIWTYDRTAFTSHEFSNEGLYLIEIQNIYGNITQYYVLKSNSFLVTMTAELADSEQFHYSRKYTEKVFSNYHIYISAYSENVTCVVTKDGQSYDVSPVKSKNLTTITLSENGDYAITLTDEFGNVHQVLAEIKASAFAIDEDSILAGYNGEELRGEEDYTKERLSIKRDGVTSNNIDYISIVYNDQETVLLDRISETKTSLDESKFSKCIGTHGDGVYKVVLRDKYGNMFQKVIHYKEETTLLLSRKITGTEILSYDVADAEEKGFWARNSLIFDTSASFCTLTINDEPVTEFPKSLDFKSGAEEGNLVYKISYKDEYGNKHEFEAHLYRQKITLTIPSDVKASEENGMYVTRNNIKLVVPNDATCTYSLNGVEKPYNTNDVLTMDGTYRFTVKDIAGNVSWLTIKKDTIVEFEMTETATGNKVINGGVICSKEVVFRALNSDSSYIKYVFRDGEQIEDYDDNKFVGNGNWEIIIADKMGNESYFAFQTILHNLSQFNYTVPYGYKVTGIWLDGDNGHESYMDFVEDEKTIKLMHNGKYTVVMSSEATGISSSFSVTINNKKPQIKLVGCNENETTLNDITISGYEVGDRIEIYRDKKLYKTVDILTSQTDAPIITEGGNYTIVVTNVAGVQSSVSFVKKYIPNTAGNVLIIVLLVMAALVVFIGLVYRQRSKVDE